MLKNKGSLTLSRNYFVIGLLIIAAIIAGIFIESRIIGESVRDTNQLNNLISTQQIKNKQNCPFECCSGNLDYNDKLCSIDYECINNKCIAIDLDKDGLTDIEERDFGSNPSIYDTDSDGLNDYNEKQKGTNPNNVNTDKDRYNDNEDLAPLNKNSANMIIEIVSQKIELNIPNIVILFGIRLTGVGLISPNSELYATKADIKIINTGDDYTNYLNYEIILSIDGSDLDKKSFSYQRVDTGANVIQHVSFSTALKDIPELLLNLITTQTEPKIKIDNIDYEKF